MSPQLLKKLTVSQTLNQDNKDICVTPGSGFVACSSFTAANPEVARNNLQASVYMILLSTDTHHNPDFTKQPNEAAVRAKPPSSLLVIFYILTALQRS